MLIQVKDMPSEKELAFLLEPGNDQLKLQSIRRANSKSRELESALMPLKKRWPNQEGRIN